MRSIFRGGARNNISVNLPCREKSLRKARVIVRNFARRQGFNNEVEDITLATQEALKNILQHACPVDDRVHFDCTIADDRMIIEVIDRGKGFDVVAFELEPESLMSPHGRGLKIIKGLMENVELESNDKGTIVHMEKLRSK